MIWSSHPVRQISGTLRAPSDKSCSHRALIMAGLAEGPSEIMGLLEGADVLNTGKAMAALGAEMSHQGPGQWRVSGVGKDGLKQASTSLDFGNSGTGSRLMMGVVAGYDIETDFIGDVSLSSRPMGRITDPLTEMGIDVEASDGKTMPLRIKGRAPLSAIRYAPPHASAQVKSAILLAGLRAAGTTIVEEAKFTRDHTERMLRGFGVEVKSKRVGAGAEVSIAGGQGLSAQDCRVPGDPSSAAFLAATAMIAETGGIVVEGVMSNETRDGFMRAAALMGATIGAESAGDATGERLIDMSFEASNLNGITVPTDIVPSMIDEFPILAVVAAFAKGETRITGAAELRVKESDRIKAVVDMLRVNGVAVEEAEDGFVVEGCDGAVPGGGLVETRHDHRIAMSALVMGTAAKAPVSIDDAAMIATSYPNFFDHMRTLGADIRETAS